MIFIFSMYRKTLQICYQCHASCEVKDFLHHLSVGFSGIFFFVSIQTLSSEHTHTFITANGGKWEHFKEKKKLVKSYI